MADYGGGYSNGAPAYGGRGGGGRGRGRGGGFQANYYGNGYNQQSRGRGGYGGNFNQGYNNNGVSNRGRGGGAAFYSRRQFDQTQGRRPSRTQSAGPDSNNPAAQARGRSPSTSKAVRYEVGDLRGSQKDEDMAFCNAAFVWAKSKYSPWKDTGLTRLSAVTRVDFDKMVTAYKDFKAEAAQKKEAAITDVLDRLACRESVYDAQMPGVGEKKFSMEQFERLKQKRDAVGAFTINHLAPTETYVDAQLADFDSSMKDIAAKEPEKIKEIRSTFEKFLKSNYGSKLQDIQREPCYIDLPGVGVDASGTPRTPLRVIGTRTLLTFEVFETRTTHTNMYLCSHDKLLASRRLNGSGFTSVKVYPGLKSHVKTSYPNGINGQQARAVLLQDYDKSHVGTAFPSGTDVIAKFDAVKAMLTTLAEPVKKGKSPDLVDFDGVKVEPATAEMLKQAVLNSYYLAGANKYDIPEDRKYEWIFNNRVELFQQMKLDGKDIASKEVSNKLARYLLLVAMEKGQISQSDGLVLRTVLDERKKEIVMEKQKLAMAAASLSSFKFTVPSSLTTESKTDT